MKTEITVVIPSNNEEAMHVFAGHLPRGGGLKRARREAKYPLTVTWIVWFDFASQDPTITAKHLTWVARMIRREVWGGQDS
jgi:hypothetical protein